MKTLLLLIALVALLAGCGTRNVIGPPKPETPAVSNGDTPNKVPYTDHRYDGEPYRGTDPDLGPTG